MQTCEQPSFLLNADIVWVDRTVPSRPEPSGKATFGITELAAEFGITLRALRFYESKGLIAPTRIERMRLYSRADRDRLALILKAKKLGFTLVEIGQMIEAQEGRADGLSLRLSRERCADQIGAIERQIEGLKTGLAELRRIQGMLSSPDAARDRP
jgi:DNA-binding transcriptional MerR regulator